MNRPLRTIAFSSPLLLATALGCSGDATDSYTAAKGAALHQAESCGDLLWQIHADALAKLDAQVARYKKSVDENDGFYEMGRGGPTIGIDDSADGDFAGDGDGDGDGAPAPASGTGGTTAGGTGTPGAESGESDGPSSPESHSETNTQVSGVDEADIVKTDGERLYVLHGNEFKILDSWPADELAELGSVQVESGGFEMFVADGFATLFSNVQVPDLPSRGGQTSDAYYEECWDCCYYGGEQFTKIATYDVTGNAPVLVRETIFEGDYVSGRRHGDAVRAIVRGGFSAPGLYYPDVDGYDSFGREKSKARLKEDLDAWREEIARDIQSTTLQDWIPRRFERVGEEWVALDMQCDGYFVPEPGLVESGVTQVVTLDLRGEQTPKVTAVLGGSDQVYANHETMVLAQVDWGWGRFGEAGTQRSIFHSFDLEQDQTSYVASGFVPGVIENQFSMDVQGDVLRVSTTENVPASDNDRWFSATENRVVTLSAEGKELTILDRSESFGLEGETIFATRFLGDRAYVVTFLQTDPLVVLDLKDPADVKILGEVKIPGFSEYIHPLDEDHLLTIGMNGENGSTDQVALQIFDVSDPTDPQQSHLELFGSGNSEAVYNHKAFTFVDDYFGEGQDLLLFPMLTYYPDYQSGLEVVRVDAKEGLSRLGFIDHTTLVNGDCSAEFGEWYPCFYDGTDEMRRGIQIDEYIYALSQGGVTVHDIAALDGEAVATVEFAAPTYETACYYGEPGFPEPGLPVEPGGVGGSSSIGGGAAMGGAVGAGAGSSE